MHNVVIYFSYDFIMKCKKQISGSMMKTNYCELLLYINLYTYFCILIHIEMKGKKLRRKLNHYTYYLFVSDGDDSIVDTS